MASTRPNGFEITGIDREALASFERDLDELAGRARAFGRDHLGIFASDFDGSEEEFDAMVFESILLALEDRALWKKRPGWSRRDLDDQRWHYRSPGDKRESASVTSLMSGNGEKIFALRTFDDGRITLHGSLDDAMDAAEQHPCLREA